MKVTASWIEPWSAEVIGDWGEHLGIKSGGGFWQAIVEDEIGNFICTGKGTTREKAVESALETAALEGE